MTITEEEKAKLKAGVSKWGDLVLKWWVPATVIIVYFSSGFDSYIDARATVIASTVVETAQTQAGLDVQNLQDDINILQDDVNEIKVDNSAFGAQLDGLEVQLSNLNDTQSEILRIMLRAGAD